MHCESGTPCVISAIGLAGVPSTPTCGLIDAFSKATEFTPEFLNQWQTIADTLGDAVWLVDASQRIVRANTASERLFGYPVGNMLGRHCFEIVHNPPVRFCECPFPRALQSMRRESMELLRDGKWFLVTVTPLTGSNGLLAGAVHVVSDITDFKKLEISLRESEERYRTLFEDAIDGLLVADLETRRFVMCNRQICRMLGYSSSELRQLAISDIHPPESIPRLTKALEKQSSGDSPLVSELPVRRKDGSVFCADISARPVNVNGQPCLMGIFRDATERLQAEKILRQNEVLLKQSQHLAKLGHYELDLAAGTWTSSEALNEVFGVDASFPKTVTGWISLLHPEDRDIMVAYFQEHVVKQRRPFDRVYRIVRPRDSAVRWVHGLGEIEAGASGRPDRMFGVIQDITESKLAEEDRQRVEAQLLQSQKLESLGLLAGGIAHDFNNLLTGVVGNLDMALLEIPSASPVRRHLLEVDQIVRKAADLCRQMLAYSGKGRFVVQRVSIQDLIDDTTQILAASISKKSELRRNFTPNLPVIDGDVTQLRQVIMNLVINASDALCDQCGVITLTTGIERCSRESHAFSYLSEPVPEGDYVFFEVTDTGCGMDAVTRKRMFEPFFSTKFPGRGLGLAAVLGIVHGHKGAIRVESEPGKGTSVRVLLPAVRGTSERQEAKPAQRAESHATGTILVVDDEEPIRAVAKKYLEHMGYHVVLAADGCEAVDLFRKIEASQEDCIACVVLDLTMPRMDGAETFKHLKALRATVPVVLSSGYDEHELANRFAGSGLAGFLQKPYRMNDLASKIQVVMQR